MRVLRAFLVLVVLALAPGAFAATDSETGTVLYLQEKQPGTDYFSTRMLVTPHYLRIDDGKDKGDFILLDRRAHAIYSVSHEDRTVLVVAARPVQLAPPRHFEHRVKRYADRYPAVAGKTVVRYQLFTNGKRCYDVFAASGLLPEAVAALREFDETMAGEHAASLSITPKDMQDTCEMANDVFLPGREYAYGFPVRQQDAAGNARELMNYRQGERFASSLFVLPAGFRRYSPGAMRGP